jgi:MacB-like periplasmic core domain/FtsX-like permease family
VGCLLGADADGVQNAPVAPVSFRVRAELRRRWLSWLALACLIGVFAGGVIAVAAGARRTDTAYSRLVTDTRAPDVMVVDQVSDTDFASFRPQDLDALPQVTWSDQVDGYTVLTPSILEIIAPTDRQVGRDEWTSKVLAGRLPDPDRADEATVAFTSAQDLHLHVGGTLHLTAQPNGDGAPVPVSLHIVGIHAAASEFPPQSGSGIDAVWVTPAFVRAHPELATTPITIMRLAHGDADGAAINAEMSRLGHGKPAESFLFSAQAANTQHSMHLQAIALWVLAGLLALAGLVVGAQLLSRQAAVESDGYRELRALGMTTDQLWGVGMIRVAVVGLVAGSIAVVGAAAASPLFPLGLARTAEPHPGVAIDPLVLGVGLVLTVVTVVLCGIWPNRRAALASSLSTSQAEAGAHRSRVAEIARSAGAPITATTGITFALDARRGRSAVPVRTTLTAVIIGIASLTAAAVFSASLAHLLASPRLYGTTWDAIIASNENEGAPLTPALRAIRHDRSIDAISVGNAGIPIVVRGTRVDALALDTDEGPALRPTVVSGRLPTRDGEITLGSRELQRLHLHLGDTIRGVSLAGVPDPEPLTVVGTAVFPTMSDDMGLGRGAYVTLGYVRAGLRHYMPGPDTILVRFRPGTDKSAAIARLNRTVGAQGTIGVQPPMKPVDLINFGRVETLPLAVGLLLGLLAASTLAHLLVTSIRRRRWDLAVLKTIGFSPGQLRRTVAWQANTVAVLALAVGTPIGVVVGRWMWLLFARQLGVLAVPTLSSGAVLVLVLGALVVANIVAFIPGQAASRTRAGQILHTA